MKDRHVQIGVENLWHGWRRPFLALSALAMFLTFAASAVAPKSALAASFTVTKIADTNDGVCNADCSLREAISAANASPGADTITVPAGTYTLTLANAGANEDNNATGDLDVLDSLTIQGAGSGTTIIQAGTTSSNGIDKVFALNPLCTSPINVTIDGISVRYGRNTQPSGAADFSFTGGGIDWCANGSGSVFTLSNSVISDNTNVNGYGGGLNVDSSSATSFTVNITNDTFQNNRTLSAANTANGGAINLFGSGLTVNVTNSTFSGNSTTNATSGGGAIYFRPTTASSLSISGATFTNNTAAGIGGAIATNTFGAGTTVSIQNSTFTGNAATNSFGGALDLDSTNLNTTPFSLTHLTITGNAAGTSGGGIYVGKSNVTLSKSLIVGNSAPTGSGIHKSVDAATATVSNNWWGCSTGPGAAPCDRATTSGGTLTFTPWYRDQLAAATSPLVTNQSTALTASFLTNSANTAVPVADLAEIIGRSVTWAATNGNLSGTQGTVQAAGTATGSFQATSAGAAVISAKVDNDNTSPVSPNVLALTVNKANTTAAITNGPTLSGTPSVTGQPVAVNYSVTGAFGNSPTAPTGSVTVSDGTDSCTGTVAAGTCTITFTSPGSKSLTATYTGDSNFNGSISVAQPHTVNRPPTTVTSITRAGGSATNTSSATWTVVFANAVSGLTASNFALANSGLGGTPAITAVTPVGGAPATSWTVTAGTGTGNGTLGLNLANDTGLDYALSNLPAIGQVYTIDRTAPTVTINQAAGQADPTDSVPLNFTVVFSEPVIGFTSADVTLGGTAGATTALVTGSGSTYNVAVSGINGPGTVIASIPAGAATDAAGNASAASTSTDNTITAASTPQWHVYMPLIKAP